MIYLLFALLPLWALIQAFRHKSYNSVFFGRWSKAERPADFWFGVVTASLVLVMATVMGLRTL
jgi:hypothetical protein